MKLTIVDNFKASFSFLFFLFIFFQIEHAFTKRMYENVVGI